MTVINQVKYERLCEELSSTKSECALLKKQIEQMKINEKRMEQNLVQNKMAIYRDLDMNEDHIKQLEKTINELRIENKVLSKGQLLIISLGISNLIKFYF